MSNSPVTAFRPAGMSPRPKGVPDEELVQLVSKDQLRFLHVQGRIQGVERRPERLSRGRDELIPHRDGPGGEPLGLEGGTVPDCPVS